MATHHLQTPFTDETIRQLHAGDVVYFDGTLFGIRDLTQIYMFDQNHEPPVSLAGMPCIHTAPSLKKIGEKWKKICIGTTTSTRMDRFSPGLIGKYGVKAIIGKGGLYEGSLKAMQEHAAVYLAIEEVYWEHLHPEALYKFRVKDFGPLTVAMDSHGRNLFEDVKEITRQKLPEIYEKLGIT